MYVTFIILNANDKMKQQIIKCTNILQKQFKSVLFQIWLYMYSATTAWCWFAWFANTINCSKID